MDLGAPPTSAQSSRPASLLEDPASSLFGRATGAFVVLLACTCVQLCRVTGSTTAWNSLWAEDGAIFATDAYHYSLLDNLFRTHAGYYQVIARLVAQPAAHIPVIAAAAWMNWSAAAVASLCGLIVWNRVGLVVHHRLTRLLLAALVPLMPQLVFEITGAVNDLHWYLIIALFWVLLVPPKSYRGAAGAALLALLASLSDPLAGIMLFAGMLGWYLTQCETLRNWQERETLRQWAVAAAGSIALVAGEIAQYLVHSAQPTSAVDHGALVQIYAVRVLLSSLVGDRIVQVLYSDLGLVVGILAALCMITILLMLYRSVRLSPTGLRAGLAIILSVVSLVVELETRGDMGILTRHPALLNGSRYTIVPLWLVYSAVLLLVDQRFAVDQRLGVDQRFAVDRRFGHSEPRSARTPTILIFIAVWLVAEALTEASVVTIRSAAPSWSQSVNQAKASCTRPASLRYRQQPLISDGLRVAPDEVVIPVAPLAPAPPPYAVIVSCPRLEK